MASLVATLVAALTTGALGSASAARAAPLVAGGRFSGSIVIVDRLGEGGFSISLTDLRSQTDLRIVDASSVTVDPQPLGTNGEEVTTVPGVTAGPVECAGRMTAFGELFSLLQGTALEPEARTFPLLGSLSCSGRFAGSTGSFTVILAGTSTFDGLQTFALSGVWVE